MRCDEARSRVEERQDGLLSEAEATAFDAHVRTCGACSEATREATAFEALLHEAGDPGREDGVVQWLSTALHAAGQEPRSRK